jgi:hypothetical protein
MTITPGSGKITSGSIITAMITVNTQSQNWRKMQI